MSQNIPRFELPHAHPRLYRFLLLHPVAHPAHIAVGRYCIYSSTAGVLAARICHHTLERSSPTSTQVALAAGDFPRFQAV
jgi:hypothetical protein